MDHVQIVLSCLSFVEARHHNSAGRIINESNETISSVTAEPVMRTSINLNQFAILVPSWPRRVNILRFIFSLFFAQFQIEADEWFL